jgi:hypothetical protein
MSARLAPVVPGSTHRRKAVWQILLATSLAFAMLSGALWASGGPDGSTSRAFAQEGEDADSEDVVAVSDAEVDAIIEVVNPQSYEVVVLRDPFDPVVPEPEPEPEPAPPATPTTPPGTTPGTTPPGTTPPGTTPPGTTPPGTTPPGTTPGCTGTQEIVCDGRVVTVTVVETVNDRDVRHDPGRGHALRRRSRHSVRQRFRPAVDRRLLRAADLPGRVRSAHLHGRHRPQVVASSSPGSRVRNRSPASFQG